MVTVTEAVLARHSVRAFLDRPVERETVAQILEIARRAPSGGNLQPWHVDVIAGEPLEALKGRVRAAFSDRPKDEGTEFPVYPPNLEEPWRSRRFRIGEQLYASIGIAREDRFGRLMQFSRNYELFAASVGLFFSIPRAFGPPQWAHLGMFMQTVMLLAAERGLGTCAQEAWAAAYETVSAFLGLPEDRMLYCGMALGWPDESHPINGWRSERAPVEEFASFRCL